jgi:hypothetical protein
MDLDHTERYVPMDYGGPPGQIRLGNLGPMARPGHRAVTHGGWQKHQPEPGYIVHRSPTGFIYLVTNQGTLPLGRTAFSNAVWEASKLKQPNRRLGPEAPRIMITGSSRRRRTAP